MDVSLTKLLLLVWALLSYGRPEGWDVAWQVRVSAYLPNISGSISLAVDPVPIYYRRLPGDLCGEYYGGGGHRGPGGPEKKLQLYPGARTGPRVAGPLLRAPPATHLRPLTALVGT